MAFYHVSTFILQLHCSYNACRFCTLFKHLQWRALPLEQIEQELQRVKSAGGSPQRIFLGDGNAFGLPTEYLVKILDMVHEVFPNVEQINMDATVSNIAAKPDEDLAKLRKMGVKCLYLGIESGLADVLAYMNKDHTIEEAYKQIARIRQFGYTYSAHIMTGISGAGHGEENARALAEFLNQTCPESITNFSLFLHRRAPLWREIEEGRFSPATELENLKEERTLLELLQLKDLKYDGFHDLVLFRVRGTLPDDRPRMLTQLDAAIAKAQSAPPVYAFVE